MTTTQAALSEDGKSIVITNSEALKAVTYRVVVNGLSDKAGNAMAKDASADAKKNASTIKEVVPSTKEIPTPNAKNSDGKVEYKATTCYVYYTVVDQYGEAMDMINVDSNNLSVTAVIDGSEYPLTAAVKNNLTDPKVKGKNRIEITYASALTVGKVINVTFTNQVSETEKYTSTFSVTVVTPDAVGTPASIESIQAASDTMKNSGTATAPEYTLNSDKDQNKFTITSKLLDKYACPATSGKVRYVSSDKDILYFKTEDTDTVVGDIDVAHSSPLTVYAKNNGEATITAYLENDDTVSFKIPVKIKPVALSKISVDKAKMRGEKNANEDKEQNGDRPTNGVNNYYKVTLNNGTGITGLRASDLQIKVLSGDATVTLYDGIGTTTEPDNDYGTVKDTIYVNVVPTADGKEKDIKYIIYTGTYDEATKRVNCCHNGLWYSLSYYIDNQTVG